jgi:hypothetical protein
MLRVLISPLAVLVAILVATRSVHCPPRKMTTLYPDPNIREIETFDFGISNLDLAVGPDKALEFFDQICNQPLDSDGYVSGAYNPSTNKFMTWTKYLATGHYSPQVFYAAHGPWHTFRGHCFWNQYNTSVQNGPRTETRHYINKSIADTSTWIEIHYDDPGFEARTSVPSWVEKCTDRQSMAKLFQDLVGLETIQTVWESLRHPEPQTRHYPGLYYNMPPCTARFLSVTRVVRTVRVTRVFSVTGWFYFVSDGHSSVGREAKGWMGLGDEFNFVQSLSAWIDGIGLQRQKPEPESYLKVQQLVYDLPPEECSTRVPESSPTPT